MKRKILSLILVFAMTVSLLTVGTGAVEPTYGDTAGHWAESSIERWSAYGIIQGSNGQFDPNGQLTCAQLATILAKLLKLPAAKDAGFTDNTADAWYYDAINRCAAAGILNGNGDGTVTPEAPITRERAMVMLARALGIEPLRKPDLTKYTDAAQVSAYAQGYVAALIEAGIVGGVTADELAPQDNINRASTVTILDRAISTYADKAGATVKADGKGIVLVVAENVKITGAPEGTKIVVADGATGLTVNGKSVSDDQTYIVPKTTTSSGSSSGGYSHSHNWVDNYCAGCNQFKDTVVAAIGTKGYETLAAAVAAAHDGDTVKLVKDITLAQRVEASFNGTIDLNGRTLTSTETCKNGSVFHVASGTLTIKNGSMIGVSGPTGWTDELYKKECDAITVANGATVTLEDLSISICSRTGACVYVFDGGKAYITSGTYINDTTEFDANGTTKAMLLNQADNKPQAIFVSGGTFKGENPANGDNSHNPSTFLAAGYKAEGADNIWTVSEDTSKTYCAQVGNGKYETLAAALAAAKDGDTVKLVGGTTLTSSAEINKSITLDLNGKTIHYTGADQENTNPTMSHRALNVTGGTVTIKNGAITTTVVGTIYPPQNNPQAEGSEFDAIIVKSGAVVTLEDMNITINDKHGSCLYVFEGGKATVKSGSYTNTNMSGDKLLLNQANVDTQLIFVEGGTFSGRSPAVGDDNKGGTFLAEGYEAVGNEGKWTVKPIFADGTGTAEDPFVIQNAEQLKAFRDKVNAGNSFAGKTVKLMADINLENEEWTPIGTNGRPFKGVFDGNDKTISNYKIIAADSNGSGLFGVIAGNVNSDFTQLSNVVSEDGTFSTTNISENKYTCVVKNLKVSNATVIGGAGTEYVSPVIGAASNAYIANINVTGTNMTVYKYGAGIVAKLDKGVVNNCTTGGTFIGSGEGAGGHIAGIVAKVSGNAPFVVMDCTNNAHITAQYGFNAGICGNVAAANSLIVYNCTNNGAISGTGANIIAGVVAHSQGGYYIGCNNKGVLSGTINDTDKGFGGIAGYITNYSHFFYNCTNTGNMSGATAPYVAGICGRSRQATTLYNCKNSGALPTSENGVAQIMNLTDHQQLYMTITGEMTTEQMIAEINKVSGDKKAVTFAGTLSDAGTLTLPADCESFTSVTQTFSNVSLTNYNVAVALNIPGEYTLTGLGEGKTVTIGGTNVNVIVPDTECNGGSIKLSGDNITLSNSGTLNHVTFTGEANSTYTLNNNGTITYTTDAGNQHTVDSVGAARNITIHNRGRIESKSNGGTGSYAMLFYNGCTVAIHDYPDSVISAGERSATYKFISNDSTVSYYLHIAGEPNDPDPIDMSSKYGTDLPSRG